MADVAAGYLYGAKSANEARAVLELARTTQRTVVPRGSGYSYGDTALNAENIVLDMTAMNRILDFDPTEGRICVEPGLTIRALWRHVIGDGWWPGVVPGAMHPTIGGCLAVNAHGKNQWHAGAINEWVEELELLLPSGEIVKCGPGELPELFHAVPGGLGMLGVILSATLRLQRVPSGLVDVQQLLAPDLDTLLALLAEHEGNADYMVGWIDGFASGTNIGRGLLQVAHHVRGGDALTREAQDLPDRVAGIIPRSWLWLGMKPTVNDPGMRALNEARYRSGKMRPGRVARVPLAQFHFFHDYIPNWKRAFQPGGIVQYQVFVPDDSALRVFRALLSGAHAGSLYPYLAVIKRHREDALSLLSYNVNGYSLSLDFHATAGNGGRLRTLLHHFTDDLVLPAGGRFYLAKDDVLTAAQARRAFGPVNVDQFLTLKRRLDPGGILSSNLYRRTFAPEGETSAVQ